ncbi:MAG: cyclic nucleotide-binding protein [Sphingomonas sp.]|uniref:CBU_0592 family membrane protein n=1 Tax=Sphingomonas sp. TaxID=28214 RepID=UPI0012156141|nr:permease [Sphingomonas sp.]THD34504.1 MAG: cyclic nucleotide-binding protein [Sphingomonas sp.]
MTLYDAIGLAGTALILGTYALTVAGRVDAKQPAALLGNFLAASLILVSLAHDFNLSAAIVESAWALIAGIGLMRVVLKR